MTILIAGAGIGGLTAALTLHAKGHEAKLYERATQLDEVGAGLQLAANGSRILRELGLMNEVEQVAFTPQAVTLRSYRSGRVISQMPLGQDHIDRYGAPYFHIHRADLHSLLVRAVQDRLGPDAITTGSAVTAYKNRPDGGVTVTVNDATEINGSVLIGADGIKSAIQTQMNGPDRPHFTGHVAWRATIPVARLADLDLPPVVTSWMAPHAHVVTYFVRGGTLLNFVGIIETSDWTGESWHEADTPAALQAAFADWHPTVQAIVGAIDTPFRWALYTRPPLSRWVDGQVALLGDACHPMLPYMAQGAGMAIEDAQIVANCLSNRTDAVTDRLQAYQNLRLARVTKVQKTAVENGKLFHLSNPLIRAATYSGMKLGSMLLPNMVERRFRWLMSYDAASIGVRD